MRFVTEGVAGRGLFQSRHGNNETGAGLIDPFPFVGMHFQNPGYPFFLTRRRIQDLSPRLHPARIDPHVGDFPALIHHYFEGQGRKWLLHGTAALFLFPGNGIDPLDGGDIFR